MLMLSHLDKGHNLSESTSEWHLIAMSKDRLTKEEAYKVITSIVDDEADEHMRSAFFEYIKKDSKLRNEFESMKRIKTLISTRCPCYKAPERLKVRVQKFILTVRNKQDPNGTFTENNGVTALDRPFPISFPASEEDNKQHARPEAGSSSTIKWVYAAAASFLIITAFWGLVYNNQPVETTYNVEEYVYQHFRKNDGKLVPPNISTASLADAEVSLSSNFDMPVTVPPLKNAEFKGVAFNEFVPDFEAPLLEYYLPGEDQYIYIFAFNVDQLNQFGKLTRDKEAIKTCIKPSDFHIENVKGKHVVSWRWDKTWYAAISNHNGKTLASLIEPLKYEQNSDN